MVWQPEVDGLEHRRQLAAQMGGEDKVAQEHAQGKLTARGRISGLADAGSFQEIGGMAGTVTYDDDKPVSVTPGDSVIGFGTLNGRKVFINAADPTVPSSAADRNVGHKLAYPQKLALEQHLPCIRLLDATSGSVLEGGRAYRGLYDSDSIADTLDLLEVAPLVTAVMGQVRGLPVVDACLSHFSVMVKGSGGASLGSDGDAAAQACHNGVIDNLADSEEDALAQIRRFLSYLPDNVYVMPPWVEPGDDPNRREEKLLSVIPRDKRKLYNPRSILKAVLDRDSVFEIGPLYGESTITGLARVNGYPVAFMAKNPMSPSVGALDTAAGVKMIRFMQLCDTFHLPMVYFVDEPGFMVGLEAQQQGVPRAGARVVTTHAQTKMPWISFIVRQLYGVAGIVFYRTNGMHKHYGWASANWGGMHVEGGATAAYRRVIADAPDPEAKRQEIERNLQALSSIYGTLEAFEVDDVIDPRETRPILCDFIETAQAVLKTQLGPGTGPVFRP